MSNGKDKILLHDYFDNLLSENEQKEFEEYLLDNIDLAIELGRLKNLQRNINNLSSNFSPPESVIENIINSLLENDGTTNSTLLDIDANQVESEEELESKIEEVKKGKTKKKRTREKISAKTKHKLKRLSIVFAFIIFIIALGYGYILYKKDNKTTPWQITITSLNAETQTSQINLNSSIETKNDEQIEIQITDIAKIELSGNSKIKVIAGTKSLSSIILYSGNLTFIPEFSNQLFELKFNNLILKSRDAKFSIVEIENSAKVNIITNYISILLAGMEYKIPKNFEFNIFSSNHITIPINNNTSNHFRKLIESYNILPNEVVLKKIIKTASKLDAFTLHYMLSQVTPEYRELIINKLQKLIPLPATTSKENVLMLSQEALDNWWDEIYFSTN